MNQIICYSCGYCCYYLRVSIINPKYIETAERLGKIEDYMFSVKEPYHDCPYIFWESYNSAKCKIHNYNIYKKLTCYFFFNNFPEDNYCIIGWNIKKRNLETKNL